MKRQTALAILAAVLGVVTLAVAAATLDDRQHTQTGNGPDGNGELVSPPAQDLSTGGGFAIPYLVESVLLLLGILLVAAGGYVVLNYREEMPKIVGFLGVVVLIVIVFWLLPSEQSPFEQLQHITLDQGWANHSGEEEPATDRFLTPILVMLAMIGVVLIAAIVLSSRAVQSPTRTEPRQQQTHEEQPALSEPMATFAGTAADRLEAGEADGNEVYRAFVEMVFLVDGTATEAATPRMVAEQAIDAGMDSRDVTSLTELFEAVRYGDRSPTPAREERAIELLRRIESRYMEGK